MRTFDEIFALAASRHGGPEALEAALSVPLSPEALEAIPEDRWLAQFTRSVFQAGFNWKVIEAKWPGFEAALNGFDVDRCAFMPPDDFDALLADPRVVRNGMKLQSIQQNAQFLQALRAEGGVAHVVARWPATDYTGLLARLGREGARLGAATGQYALRFIGRDGFILSRDVTARLIAEGVIDKPATSKGALKAVQAAFDTWCAQSGRGLTQVSQVLARSL